MVPLYRWTGRYRIDHPAVSSVLRDMDTQARPHTYRRWAILPYSLLHRRSSLPIPCPGHFGGGLCQGELLSDGCA